MDGKLIGFMKSHHFKTKQYEFFKTKQYEFSKN